jgi:hypothetical protein
MKTSIWEPFRRAMVINKRRREHASRILRSKTRDRETRPDLIGKKSGVRPVCWIDKAKETAEFVSNFRQLEALLSDIKSGDVRFYRTGNWGATGVVANRVRERLRHKQFIPKNCGRIKINCHMEYMRAEGLD